MFCSCVRWLVLILFLMVEHAWLSVCTINLSFHENHLHAFVCYMSSSFECLCIWSLHERWKIKNFQEKRKFWMLNKIANSSRSCAIEKLQPYFVQEPQVSSQVNERSSFEGSQSHPVKRSTSSASYTSEPSESSAKPQNSLVLPTRNHRRSHGYSRKVKKERHVFALLPNDL